jgi:hypothetical protein
MGMRSKGGDEVWGYSGVTDYAGFPALGKRRPSVENDCHDGCFALVLRISWTPFLRSCTSDDLALPTILDSVPTLPIEKPFTVCYLLLTSCSSIACSFPFFIQLVNIKAAPILDLSFDPPHRETNYLSQVECRYVKWVLKEKASLCRPRDGSQRFTYSNIELLRLECEKSKTSLSPRRSWWSYRLCVRTHIILFVCTRYATLLTEQCRAKSELSCSMRERGIKAI